MFFTAAQFGRARYGCAQMSAHLHARRQVGEFRFVVPPTYPGDARPNVRDGLYALHPDDLVDVEAAGMRQNDNAVHSNKFLNGAIKDGCRETGFGAQLCTRNGIRGRLGKKCAYDDRDWSKVRKKKKMYQLPVGYFWAIRSTVHM